MAEVILQAASSGVGHLWSRTRAAACCHYCYFRRLRHLGCEAFQWRHQPPHATQRALPRPRPRAIRWHLNLIQQNSDSWMPCTLTTPLHQDWLPAFQTSILHNLTSLSCISSFIQLPTPRFPALWTRISRHRRERENNLHGSVTQFLSRTSLRHLHVPTII